MSKTNLDGATFYCDHALNFDPAAQTLTVIDMKDPLKQKATFFLNRFHGIRRVERPAIDTLPDERIPASVFYMAERILRFEADRDAARVHYGEA